MKEKILIIFIASILGLLITTGIFYIYQSTKNVPIPDTKQIAGIATTPTPKVESNQVLVVEEPKDEAVVNKRTIEIKGKTKPNNTVVISSGQEDVVGNASSEGNFALTLDIEAGANKIVTRSIDDAGNETIDERVITYNSEDF